MWGVGGLGFRILSGVLWLLEFYVFNVFMAFKDFMAFKQHGRGGAAVGQNQCVCVGGGALVPWLGVQCAMCCGGGWWWVMVWWCGGVRRMVGGGG